MINEEQISAELMTRFKGRVALIAAAAAGVGLLVGAVLF
jgi:hypothetical protein